MDDILIDMEAKDRRKSGRGNAMLVSDSVHAACRFFWAFNETDLKRKYAIVTSYRRAPGDISGEEARAGVTKALLKHTVYRRMLADHFGQSEDEAIHQTEEFVVVAKGYKQLKHGARDALRCHSDSAVARTNVEWPTDVRFLCDALRSLVNELYGHCKAAGMKGWRKARWWVKSITTVYRRCRRARKNGFLGHIRHFLTIPRRIITKALGTVKTLKEVTDKIAWYQEASEKLVDQVDRRLLKEEEIDHQREDIFFFRAAYAVGQERLAC